MEVNAIVRKTTIDIITGEPNAIIKWFDQLWAQLIAIRMPVKYLDNQNGEVIYSIGGDKGKVVFYHDEIRNAIQCDYELYWQVLEFDFNLPHDHIQDITKILFENALGHNTNITRPKMVYHLRLILP